VARRQPREQAAPGERRRLGAVVADASRVGGPRGGARRRQARAEASGAQAQASPSGRRLQPWRGPTARGAQRGSGTCELAAAGRVAPERGARERARDRGPSERNERRVAARRVSGQREERSARVQTMQAKPRRRQQAGHWRGEARSACAGRRLRAGASGSVRGRRRGPSGGRLQAAPEHRAELGKWRAALAAGADAGWHGVRAQEALAQATAVNGRAEAGGVCRCRAAGAEVWARGIGVRGRCWSGRSRLRMEHAGSTVLSRRVCRRRTWQLELAA
jgi:hypothetical protein